jgi:membrane protein required for colicin V production
MDVGKTEYGERSFVFLSPCSVPPFSPQNMILDLFILLPILYGAYRGYQKGLLIEIIGIAAFILAIVVGFKFLGFGMNMLAPYIGEQMSYRFLPYLSFTLIFFPTIFLLNKFGWMLRKALRFTILGTVDGFAGAIVGAFTWVFGISIFLWLLKTIEVKIPEQYAKDSVSYEHIIKVAPAVVSKVSDWIPAGGNLIKDLANA